MIQAFTSTGVNKGNILSHWFMMQLYVSYALLYQMNSNDSCCPFKEVEKVSIGHGLEPFMSFILEGMLLVGALEIYLYV